MLLPYLFGFGVLVLMVGVLIWVRRKPTVSEGFDRMTASLSGNERWQSFEILALGLFLAATALLRRLDDEAGGITLVRAEQPGYLLLTLALYFVLIGLIFLVVPRHVSKLFVGFGLVGLGAFVLLSAILAKWGGHRLVSLYGNGIDEFLSEYPVIVMILGGFIVLGGITNIRRYFRERAISLRLP